LRSTKAEAALKNKGLKDSVQAACKACVAGAEPLKDNGYKVDSTKGVLEEALGLLT
jgi:CO/xanthine dehydrogenase FAD-binding subunit